MTIEKRVHHAIKHFQECDDESALYEICSAIEATTIRVDGKGGRSNYKKFINENIELISAIATNGMVRCKGYGLDYSHPSLPQSGASGCTLEDVFYHVVRCGMYHESKIPENIVFHETILIGSEKGTLFLSRNFILGLIVAVMADPTNIEFKGPPSSSLTCRSMTLSFDDAWGLGRDAIMEKIYAT